MPAALYGKQGEQKDESTPEKRCKLEVQAGAPCIACQKDGDAESFLTGKQN
jgi:hypothetical protein